MGNNENLSLNPSHGCGESHHSNTFQCSIENTETEVNQAAVRATLSILQTINTETNSEQWREG